MRSNVTNNPFFSIFEKILKNFNLSPDLQETSGFKYSNEIPVTYNITSFSISL